MAKVKVQVKVKKVPAYPIPGRLKLGEDSFPASVLKLSGRGLMVELKGTTIKPGDRLQISFELPVLHFMVRAEVLVVKAYNQKPLDGIPLASTVPGEGLHRILELHFQHVDELTSTEIQRFLDQIKEPK